MHFDRIQKILFLMVHTFYPENTDVSIALQNIAWLAGVKF